MNRNSVQYIHILTNHAVVSPFVELINKSFNEREHLFFIINGISTDKISIPNYRNVHLIRSFNSSFIFFKLIFQLNSCKKIFLHGLFSSPILVLLWLQPWLLKKSNWLIWGGDLYQNI